MKKSELSKSILDLVKKVKAIPSISKYDNLVDALDGIAADVKEQVFRVTVVGEFSSGKSTFLNALIGRDLLPHAVSETTATITYIHNVPAEDSRNNKAVIHYPHTFILF